MLVSMIVGTLRTISGYTEEPAQILNELNRRLFNRMHSGFATCLVARLEDQGRLTFANAGPLPPYKNGAEITFPGSLPLAMSETATYDQTTLDLGLGDGLVIMTDGVVEAQNEAKGGQRTLFGFARIESMLSAHATAKQMADSAQQHGQNDDITVLSVGRLA